MNKMVERYDDLVDIITEQYEDDIINESIYNRMISKITAKYAPYLEGFIDEEYKRIEKMSEDGKITPREREAQIRMLKNREDIYKYNIEREKKEKEENERRSAKENELEEKKLKNRITKLATNSVKTIQSKIASFKSKNPKATNPEIKKEISAAYKEERDKINDISNTDVRGSVLDEIKRRLASIQPKLYTESAEELEDTSDLDDKEESKNNDESDFDDIEVTEYLDSNDEKDVFKAFHDLFDELDDKDMLTDEGNKEFKKGMSKSTKITVDMVTDDGKEHILNLIKDGDLLSDLNAE